MNARKAHFRAMVAVLILATLVACAPATTPAPTEAPTTEAPPTEAPPTEAPTAAEGPVYGGTIVIAHPSDIPTFDPPVTWDPDSWGAQILTHSSLYRFQYGSAEIEPDLAADMPQVSEDGSVWTIPLRQDVKFSNGDPLTARDVKYSWDRMLDDETQGWAVTYYMAVKGAAEAFGGEADEVEGVKVLDDYTIQFELAEPIAYFDKLLAMPWTSVVNQKHVEEVGEDIARNPLGSGPYVLTEYEAAVRAVFEKNPHYFREDEPYADRVVFELNTDPALAALKLEQGEIDLYSERLVPADFLRLKEDAAFEGETFEIPWLDAFFITINSRQEPLKDLRVRQAIAHALDRERIIKAAFGGFGEPAHTIVPPGDPLAYNADQPIYEYDLEKAKALLAEAGYPDGFTFKAASSNYNPWDKFAQAIQADLAQVGITMDLELLEQSAWYEWNSREDNGFTFMHWPYEIPDPAYIFDGGFSEAAMFPDSCCNFSWYSTPELEEMLAAARVESDPVKRGELYQELDELLAYDVALWIPLWYPIETYVTSENLGGFQPPAVMHPRMTEPWRYWSKSGE